MMIHRDLMIAASRVRAGVRDVGDSDDDDSVREGGDGVGTDGRRGIEIKKSQSRVGGRKNRIVAVRVVRLVRVLDVPVFFVAFLALRVCLPGQVNV